MTNILKLISARGFLSFWAITTTVYFSTSGEVWGLQVNLSAISHGNMKIIHKTNIESTQALWEISLVKGDQVIYWFEQMCVLFRMN